MELSIHTNENDGSTWIRFSVIGDWHYFPLPLNYFVDENKCIVISNHETMHFREARLKKGDIEFELLHDDLFGNFISTNNPQDVPLLKQLAENVLACIAKQA